MKVDLLDVIERAYAVDVPESEWLEGILGAARRELEAELGMGGYFYDVSVRPIRIWGMRAPMVQEELQSALGTVDEDYIQKGWLTVRFVATSEVPGFDRQQGLSRHLRDYGVEDVICLNALDTSGVGVMFGGFHRTRTSTSSAQREVWGRVSTHIAAGLRLRLRLEARNALQSQRELTGAFAPDAVFSPSGRLEHAENGQVADAHGEMLRQAVVTVERARGAMRHEDPHRAVELWRGLVRGRWSLVDRFEHNGKRYVLACQNNPDAKGPDTLTERERQILAHVALGRAVKVVAYELGLSSSTVRVHLANAASKLRAASRAELVTKYRKWLNGR